MFLPVSLLVLCNNWSAVSLAPRPSVDEALIVSIMTDRLDFEHGPLVFVEVCEAWPGRRPLTLQGRVQLGPRLGIAWALPRRCLDRDLQRVGFAQFLSDNQPSQRGENVGKLKRIVSRVFHRCNAIFTRFTVSFHRRNRLVFALPGVKKLHCFSLFLKMLRL